MWQPIDENTPRDGSPIIALDGVTAMTVRWEQGTSCRFPLWGWRVMFPKPDSLLLYINPTHWMPLPTPPEQPQQAQN